MSKSLVLVSALLAAGLLPVFANDAPAPAPAAAVDDYVPSLVTDTPLQGRQLAITLVRKTIGSIQRDGDAKRRVRDKYQEDPALLMRAAELVAIEFRTIAEANDYWRDPPASAEQAPRTGER